MVKRTPARFRMRQYALKVLNNAPRVHESIKKGTKDTQKQRLPQCDLRMLNPMESAGVNLDQQHPTGSNLRNTGLWHQSHFA